MYLEYRIAVQFLHSSPHTCMSYILDGEKFTPSFFALLSPTARSFHPYRYTERSLNAHSHLCLDGLPPIPLLDHARCTTGGLESISLRLTTASPSNGRTRFSPASNDISPDECSFSPRGISVPAHFCNYQLVNLFPVRTTSSHDCISDCP